MKLVYCLTENIQNAKFKSGKYIIKVKDHKTKRTHGPANFCADRDLYNNLVFFVNYVRPSVTPVNDFLFVTLSGQSKSSGQISTQLHSFVKRCNGYGDAVPPRRVCANIMRKCALTLTLQERKGDSACMASLQTHSEGTALKYYRLVDREAKALEGTEVLKDLFGQRKTQLWPENTLKLLKQTFSNEICQQKISMDAVQKRKCQSICLNNF